MTEVKYKKKRYYVDISGHSLTEQHHKDDCDITKIMARFERTGQLPLAIQDVPRYEDFSDVVDFHSAMVRVKAAEEAFMTLQPDVRAFYKNDPGLFLDALENPEQREYLIKHGILADLEAQGAKIINDLMPTHRVGSESPVGDSKGNEGTNVEGA